MGSKFGRNYPVLSKSNEKERVLFILAAGLAFSLLVVLVIVVKFKSSSSGSSDENPYAAIDQSSDVSTVTLLAPERPVRAGTPLSEVQFKEVFWPRNQVPKGAVRDRAELQSLFAKVDIPEGVPLQRTHLTSQQMNTNILPLTPGNRAVAIEINATSGIEYHVIPGTRVDVILTYYSNRELTSKVIVQNARVLSLGGDATIRNDPNQPVRRLAMQTITLDVSPSDALRLSTAKRLGQLSLMMRSAGDVKPSAVNEITQQNIDSNLEGNQKRTPARTCKKGRIRIAGEGEFLLDCDGTMTPILDNYEP